VLSRPSSSPPVHPAYPDDVLRGHVLPGVVAAVALAASLVSCAATTPPAPAISLPPAGGSPDYQLGGAYPPADGVTIVARDRAAEPAEGLYSICYVNAFQTQPGEQGDWPADTLLRTADGAAFIDPGWPDEVILDTSTDSSREAIAAVLRPWIEGCAADGFDAVEFDNLDTFTRSEGALTFDDNAALAALLVRIAHEADLAAGQKNAAEYADELAGRAGFDFAVAEECAAFDECEAYTAVYGDAVVDIEYTDQLPEDFAQLCERAPHSTVLRDRALSEPGDADYAFALC
jgi:hypothetical protein